MASLGLALLDGLLDVLNEEVLVLIARDTGKRLVLAVLELPCPGQEGESGTGETGVVAKRSNTATVLIFEELKIKKGAVTPGKTTKNGVGRFGEPAEVAATVAFLASDQARLFVGQTLGPNSGDVML